jgi:hypothetical protein
LTRLHLRIVGDGHIDWIAWSSQNHTARGGGNRWLFL